MSLSANDLHGRHLIVNNREWKTIINALDVLHVIVSGDALDSDLVRELRDTFPPGLVDELSTKIVHTR
jgi:hypothetical protein